MRVPNGSILIVEDEAKVAEAVREGLEAEGYAVARRALGPIDRMTLSARRITAARLSERLPVENPAAGRTTPPAG
jgi:DNA-binding response OmpR family regulator